MQTQRDGLIITARFTAMLVVMSVLALLLDTKYADLFLPLYRTVLRLALPEFSLGSLRVGSPQGEALVMANFIANRALQFQGVWQPPGVSIDASTLVGHGLKHIVLLTAALFAVPAAGARAWGSRLVLGVFLLIILEAIDIPLVLAGAVRDLLEADVSSVAKRAGLVLWIHLLDGGGRIALPLAAGICIAMIAQRNQPTAQAISLPSSETTLRKRKPHQ